MTHRTYASLESGTYSMLPPDNGILKQRCLSLAAAALCIVGALSHRNIRNHGAETHRLQRLPVAEQISLAEIGAASVQCPDRTGAPGPTKPLPSRKAEHDAVITGLQKGLCRLTAN